MDELSLVDLGVFVRAAALGSLSAVARERGVPVSQISRALDRMELACGVTLARRSVRGLTLTPEGEDFLAFCGGVGAQRDELLAGLAQRTRQVSGRVRLSVSAVVAHYWVVPSLPALTLRHPGLAIDLLIDDQRVDLARDGVDIAIRTGLPATQSMVARPLGTITTGLYASSAYLARNGTPGSVDELARHALLANCTNRVLNRLCFRRGRALVADGLLRSGSTAVVAQMAAQGLGIAHLPTHVATRMDAGLLPLLQDQFEPARISVSAIMLSDPRRRPSVRACLDHLADVFTQAEV